MISTFVNLDNIYSEMDNYDKNKMVQKLCNDGYLKKAGYIEDKWEESNEYLNKWEESINKLSKVNKHSVSNEDEEIITKLAQKYYL